MDSRARGEDRLGPGWRWGLVEVLVAWGGGRGAHYECRLMAGGWDDGRDPGMTTSSAPSIPFRIRKVLRSAPAVTTALHSARALIHFGPWRHAFRAVIRWKRPPLRGDATRTAGSVSLNAPALARTLREDGMVRAGQLPSDVLRRLRAITDDLPPGEYGHFDEQPDIGALVFGADVLNVVRGYLGAEPELLECNLVVGQAEDPVRTPVHSQRRFHFDFAGWQSLNLFVYLTDVEEDSGAHQVVIGTHRGRQLRDAIRAWVPDEEISARYPGRGADHCGAGGHDVLREYGSVPSAADAQAAAGDDQHAVRVAPELVERGAADAEVFGLRAGSGRRRLRAVGTRVGP